MPTGKHLDVADVIGLVVRFPRRRAEGDRQAAERSDDHDEERRHPGSTGRPQDSEHGDRA